MRPIALKIKGLNSFMEEQEIQFEPLMEQGFFGIFGPTGSGKTTVLDGIMLALYGAMPRKSADFINANMTTATVSFTFQIHGKQTKCYMAEREFKQDKKTGKPRTGKCRLVDISDGGMEILADSVKTVTAGCQDILGLSYDDFVRTVVLPQGKFSEFLTLKGSDRNNMLERLFHLEQYGEELVSKLKHTMEQEEKEYCRMEGELAAYLDVSEEDYQEKAEFYEQLEVQYEEAVRQREKTIQQQKEGEHIWKLQLEKTEYECIKQELEEQKIEAEKAEQELQWGKQAENVRPYVDNYTKQEQKRTETAEEKQKEEKKTEQLLMRKAELDKQYEEVKRVFDTQLPVLKLKEEQGKEAVSLKKELDVEEQEEKNVTVEIKNLCSRMQRNKEEQTAGQNKITELEQMLVQLKGERKRYFTEPSEREQVQKGVLAERDYEQAYEQEGKLRAELEEQKVCLQQLKQTCIEQKTVWETTGTKLDGVRAELELLKAGCPGNEDVLHQLFREKTEKENAWNHYKDWKKKKEEQEKKYQSEEKTAEVLREEELRLLERAGRLKKETARWQKQQMADELRKYLQENEPCPVCGSRHHVWEKDAEDVHENDRTEEYDKVQTELLKVQEKRMLCEQKMAIYEHDIKEKQEQIASLGTEFLAVNMQELSASYETLQADMRAYQKRLQELQEKEQQLQTHFRTQETSYIQKSTEYSEKEKQYEKLQKEYEQKKAICRQFLEVYEQLLKEAGAERFDVYQEDLTKKEQKYHLAGQQLEEKESALELQKKNKKDLEHAFQELEKQLAMLDVKQKHMQLEMQKKREMIQKKTDGAGQAEEWLLGITKAIEEVKEREEAVRIQKDTMQQSYDRQKSIFEQLTGRYEELEKQVMTCKMQLDDALETYGFATLEMWDEHQMPTDIIQEKQMYLEQYRSRQDENRLNLDRVEKELQGRMLTEEEWKLCQQKYEQAEQHLQEISEQRTAFRQQLADMKKKLEQQKIILKEKQQKEHRIALLKDLQKLFSGKRFVQYVAAEHLKYVSVEASKILMDISGGSYGVEIDEKNEFIIRDYKNGGFARDASTLSGGELFLVSLALALALSTQIQLRNEAPLELFFLDEGFGTLDEHLLDEVMAVLEKLQHKNRAIGLISHVEEIKNRVPVKLLVTPAKTGEGGSRVRMERT